MSVPSVRHLSYQKRLPRLAACPAAPSLVLPARKEDDDTRRCSAVLNDALLILVTTVSEEDHFLLCVKWKKS